MWKHFKSIIPDSSNTLNKKSRLFKYTVYIIKTKQHDWHYTNIQSYTQISKLA